MYQLIYRKGNYMAAEIAIASTLFQLDAMNDADKKSKKDAEIKRQNLLKEQKIILAEKRANKHAGGISGRSYESSEQNIKNSYQQKIGSITGGTDNTMGQINLLTKNILPLVTGYK